MNLHFRKALARYNQLNNFAFAQVSRAEQKW